MTRFLYLLTGAAALGLVLLPAAPVRAQSTRPNIIFIMADDLGYGDLGCYGQQKIKTPNLDRMARDGIRFTQAYAGTSVCAPTRCSLMTGQHTGHTPIRANREVQPEGQRPIPADSYTVAQLLKTVGYHTACIGKWGLGMFGTTGDPLKHGFDHFFGYNCQRHAHSYFPTYLWNDDKHINLDGKTYAQDLIADETLRWVRQNKDGPFFLYYALTLPHGRYEIPSVAPYENEKWPQVDKTYAAMVTRMDRDVGRLLALLHELGLEDNTVVFFTSDHGAARASSLFNSSGGLRGIKRSMYEGGLRVPMIVRWPGQIPAGKVSAEPWAFWDFLPTCAELSGAKIPAGVRVDGLSVVSALKGGKAPEREYFYWELHEGGAKQAVRFGDWVAVKPGPNAKVELYDLKNDPRQQHDRAADRPQILARAVELLRTAREDSPDWPLTGGAKGKKKAKTKAG